MKTIRIILALTAWSLFLVRGADAKITEQEFRSQYPSASKQLEEFYAHLTMRMVTENISPQGSKLHSTVIYQSNGDSLRVTRTNHEQADRESVCVISTGLSFRLNKQADQTQYFLQDIRRSRPKEWEESFWLSAPLALAPYGCLGYRVVDWMAEPGFSIQGISEEGDGQDRIVRVDWICVFKDPGETIERAGSFLFLPEHKWVLRECLTGYASKTTRRHCTLEYESNSISKGGFPIIRQSRSWSDTPERREFVEIVRAEEVLIQPAHPSQFQLSSFGIPDQVERKAFDRGWIWLLAGTAGLVLAALLRRIARHRKS
jgi:hypothetical protein